MEIHVLYDNWPQPDKLPDLLNELRSQGLEPTKIWEPIHAKTVVESINISIKQIVQYAKDKGLSEVVIVEDDLMFSCEGAWEYFISNMPTIYDIYIGGNYLLHQPDNYHPPYYRVKEYVGNQLIVVNSSYYDAFLSVPNEAHIDTVQSGRGDFYACFPMVALQRPGYSSNIGQVVDYNKILKPEWIYNGALYNLQG